MIKTIPFAVAVFIWAAASARATPQRRPRDDNFCLDRTTITITAAAGGPTPPSDSGEQQANGILSTVAIVRPIDHVSAPPPEKVAEKTVTIFSTITVQAAQETEVSPLTANPDESSSSGPAAPFLPVVYPPNRNDTEHAPRGNSSLPSRNSTSAFVHMSATPSLPRGSTSVTAEIDLSPTYPPPVSSGYENSLYFTNWGIYGADYQPQALPVSKITRVYYAFASFGSDGRVISSDTYADLEKRYATDSWNDVGENAYGCVKQLYLLKRQNRHLKVILSIGGWNDSPKFPAMAASATARQTFASSAVKLVTDWGFDGIDIDWEYPETQAQASDFVLLLEEVRRQLDAWTAAHTQGYRFLLTVASPAGPEHYNVMDLEEADKYVDSWNLMTYDYAGSWDTTSGHQANLYAGAGNTAGAKYSTDRAIGDYMAKGVSASKILLGLPTYGRAFDLTAGIGEPFHGVGPGSAVLQTPGLWLYKDLPRPGAAELYDEAAGASYSYDASSRELISYDNIRSARVKGSYLINKGLAGCFFWEASGDKKGAESLVGTLAEELGKLNVQPNLLSYPTSQYDNIRNGLSGA